MDSFDEDMAVDFSGYEIWEVLQVLHDCAPPASDFYYKLGSVSLDTCKKTLETRDVINYFGYGRYINVDFSTFPLLDPAGYDNVNGDGMMDKAFDMLYKRSQY